MASPLQALRSAAARLLEAARNRETMQRQSHTDDPARQVREQQSRIEQQRQYDERARYEAQQRGNDEY
jgi:hypothetical protein